MIEPRIGKIATYTFTSEKEIEFPEGHPAKNMDPEHLQFFTVITDTPIRVLNQHQLKDGTFEVMLGATTE